MWALTQGISSLLALRGYMNIRADAFSDHRGDYAWMDDPFMKYVEDLPALIAVMGVTGSGKTTFVNQASKSRMKVGEDLESCTSEIQESDEFILDGRRVVLIDTPGFDDTHKSDTDVFRSIAAFLGKSYSIDARLAGVIYVHRISDDRFGGLAVKNFRMFRELCGEKTLKNVVIMTNMWGRVSPRQEAEREEQLKDKYFKAAIEKGAQMCRHANTPESARAIVRKILENQPLVLKIQHELVTEGKDIGQTGVGAELNRETLEVVERYERQIRDLEAVRKAMEEKHNGSREELEEEKKRMQEDMERRLKDSAEMQSKFEEARREMEERINTRLEAQGRVNEWERSGRRSAPLIASSRPVNTVVHCEMPDASGLAPMAPTLPPTSRTPEPPANTVIVEIVQPATPVPPTFIFGTGPSSSSLDSDPPLDGVTSVHRHPKYYMDTDMVVFKVNGYLYRVHKHFFVSEAGFFRDIFVLPQPGGKAEANPKEGTTDDTAIPIPDVTCKEFEALLDFFYYRESTREETRSIDQWVSLLSISTRFQLDRIRRRSISEIESHRPQLHAVDKAVLAAKHSVDPWLTPAYCDICERAEPLTVQEAEKLGAVTTARLARARELLRKSGRPFPLLMDSVDSRKAFRKHTESIIAQVLAPTKIVQGLLTQTSSNAATSTTPVSI